VALPITPPVEPMLARLTRELPRDGFLYEPKWDGFRVLAFRDGDEVDLRSRNQRPLARYFPEIVEAMLRLDERSVVLDGEIVVVREDGRFDFAALMSRLHPAATRVALLRETVPATFVAFDLLAIGDEALVGRPCEGRRRRLDALIGDRSAIRRTPATQDADVAARWLTTFHGGGIDGVIAKRPDQPYTPGRRTMVKVKHARTADCVVAGFRLRADRDELGALLLGLFDGPVLRHVGVASSFSRRRAMQLMSDVADLATSIDGHPWEHGFGLDRSPLGRLAGAAGRWVPGEMEMDWVPVRPVRVCEVTYDTLDEGRFRYPARFVRWRPDRAPASCTFEQFEEALPDVTAVLASA
jgi:ATP-dependent DNA ligase